MKRSKIKVLNIISIAFTMNSAGKNAMPNFATNAAVTIVHPTADPTLKKKVISQHSVTRGH
ncbi:MAG: hypothetical protein AAB606_00160 [Patescibacteria group bacterium]